MALGHVKPSNALQCGPVVRALALRSGDPGFKTRSDHLLNLFLVVPGSTSPAAALVDSQLVCLRPVGILNSCCFVHGVSLALKSPHGAGSIKYVIVLYCERGKYL